MRVKNKYARSAWARVLSVVLLTSVFLCSSVFAQQGKKRAGYLDLLMKSKTKGHVVTAINNAKQVFLLLFEFDQDIGQYPSDETATDDLADYKGKHANDYLGQFIAGGYTQFEEIFYVKGASATEKMPDNDISTKDKTLEAGECGFAYYKGSSSASPSSVPLLMTPMTGKGFKFDPKPFKGVAIVLHNDGSVRKYVIDDQGDVVLNNGKKLFEGGADTVWGAKGPDAKQLVFPK